MPTFNVRTANHEIDIEADRFSKDPETGDLNLKNESVGTVGHVPAGALEGLFRPEWVR